MSKQPLPQMPRWDGPLSHPFYSHVVKRIIDFLFALILLIPGCIIMLPLAIWVKLDSPGPVLYKSTTPRNTRCVPSLRCSCQRTPPCTAGTR